MNVSHSQGGEKLRDIDLLGYALVLQAVQVGPRPPAPTFLFRAARHAIQRTSYVPPIARQTWSFHNFRRCHPVDDFLAALGRHLGKTRDFNCISIQAIDKHLTSMSPILEWALHKTGQKWNDCPSDDQVELIIYDLQALRNVSDVAVFRISDVLRFLERQNKRHNIDAELKRWAENCDEYIAVGKDFHDAHVRSLPWKDLCNMPIISATFSRAYTLGIYCQWRDETRGQYGIIEKGDACLQLLTSAKTIAGAGQQDVGRVREILRLILLPGIWFWGIETDVPVDEVFEECNALLEDDLTYKLSQVSVKN